MPRYLGATHDGHVIHDDVPTDFHLFVLVPGMDTRLHIRSRDMGGTCGFAIWEAGKVVFRSSQYFLLFFLNWECCSFCFTSDFHIMLPFDMVLAAVIQEHIESLVGFPCQCCVAKGIPQAFQKDACIFRI